jgi:hypothetical protein
LSRRFISRAIVELQKGMGLKRCDPIDCDSHVSECRRDAEEEEVKCQEKRKERELLQNGIASLIKEQHEQKALKHWKKATLQDWWHTTQAVVQG